MKSSHSGLTEGEHLRNFIRWLEANGATFPAMQIQTIDGMRGVRVKNTVQAGELVLHLPKQLILTLESAQASSLGVRMKTSGTRFTRMAFFAAFLINDLRTGGFWSPYIEMLPPEIFTMHAYCPNKIVARLKGTAIDPTGAAQRVTSNGILGKEMLSDYLAVKPLLGRLGLREFSRIWSAVATRAFVVKVDGVDTQAIVPLADMLNHSQTPNVAWSVNVTDGYRFVAIDPIGRAGELTDNYGPRSNGELFRQYGFCLENNPWNRVAIEVPDVAITHPAYSFTRTFGEQKGNWRRFFVTADSTDKSAAALLTYLRVICETDSAALRHHLSALSHERLLAVSHETERAAMDELARACKRAMARYGKLVEGDELLLSNSDLPWIERCAAFVGVGERRIIERYANLAASAFATVHSSQREAAYQQATIAHRGAIGVASDKFSNVQAD
ncbi:MAG TPA: SET domain-containing histone-lysine N-methyltransferase [Burkholderiaceae bacterium]|jgi:histone-lysine N-methyltransferase SETD3